jgi:hypothetical protein
MAASDFMALTSNFSQWQKTRGEGLTGAIPFNYYVAENFLKAYPVNDKEIMAGSVDKSGDGGIDAFYFFANRKFVFEDTKLDPDSDYKFNLVIFQCKEGNGFSPIEMGKFVFFADDLLDPHREEADYKDSYHDKLKALMQTFKDKYSQVAGSVTSMEIDLIYVSKLDVDEPADDTDVKEKETLLAKTVAKHFPKAAFNMNYVNAAKLLTQVQLRKRKDKGLVYESQAIQTPEGWVVLVRLAALYKFLQDDHGNFFEQMLEENVRGFQGKTPVNDGIKLTLKEPAESAEFWLLNNGITVLTEEIKPGPKATLTIINPQIVNGLQTSRHIFEYYKGGAGIPPEDKRRILVRVIETNDDDIRDQIINATNSQNKMPAEALRATDPIQKKIEDVFATYGLFYDRRKGHYKDLGKPAKKIVSVREVLQATLAVLLRLPDVARGRPTDYLNEEEKYKEVYLDEKVPLTVHVKSTELVSRIEGHKSKQAHKDRLLDLQFYVAYIAAARTLGNAHVPAQKLAALNVPKIKDAVISRAFNDAYTAYMKFGGDANASKSREMREYVIKKMETELHAKKK